VIQALQPCVSKLVSVTKVGRKSADSSTETSFIELSSTQSSCRLLCEEADHENGSSATRQTLLDKSAFYPFYFGM
jgi:hypothetical protein